MLVKVVIYFLSNDIKAFPYQIIRSVPILALGSGGPCSNIMAKNFDEKIIPQEMKKHILTRSLITGTATIGLFTGYLASGSDISKGRTIALSSLVLSQLFDYDQYSKSNGSNKLQYSTIGASTALLLASIYIPFFRSIFLTSPLGFMDWGIILTTIGT